MADRKELSVDSPLLDFDLHHDQHGALSLLEVIDPIIDALEEGEERHLELLWRKARAFFDASEQLPVGDKKGKEKHLRDGVEVAEKLLELADDEYWPAHKWFAVLKSGLSTHLPTKEKVANAYLIREHADRVLELHPEDTTTTHLIGRWCFNVASVGWMERKVAQVVFATPPESSYDEALEYFLKADALNPTLRNTQFIAQCHELLKQKDEARAAYQKCAEWDAKTEHDRQVVAEANAKLKRM